MIPLDDPRWSTLHRPCFPKLSDIADRLRDLESAGDIVALTRAWDDLRDAIHYQGDVSVGSYAAVPHMVRICDADRGKLDWNLFAWVGLVEECRVTVPRNPQLPVDVEPDYTTAMDRMHDLVHAISRREWDGDTAQCIVRWQLLAKGLPEVAVALDELPWPRGKS